MQYQIMTSDNLSDLGDTVTRMLMDDWELAGGVAVTYEHISEKQAVAVFAQALVKNLVGPTESAHDSSGQYQHEL